MQSFAMAGVVLLVACCALAHAAVLPLEKGGMGVHVEAGTYTVCGRDVNVSSAVDLAIDPADKVVVSSEEHVLSDEAPRMWQGGTSLARTFGPVDKLTRLPFAIDQGSVKLHSAPDGGTVYREGTDYILEHTWGAIARSADGTIPKQAKVWVDYEVWLERIDVVQVSGDGNVAVKKGKSVPVIPDIPAVDPGCTVLANVYVQLRSTEITKESIYPYPAADITWRDFIRVSGREHLSHTLGLLKEGKPVTVVCWGDSVTDGGSPSSHDKCYVELFRQRLQSAYPRSRIDLTNAGIGGSNTDTRRAGYEKDVLSHNPDLITVEFVNDWGFPPDKIKANWHEFITRAREKNPNVEFILLTPHFLMPQWMGRYDKPISAMRQAAEDNGVALADTTNIWANLRQVAIPYQTLLANGINHPNDLGHEFFAATLMALMSQAK